MSIYNYIFPDGGIYYGELNKQKQPEGKGICEWPDGSKYDGHWVDGKKHGTGLLISINETVKGFWYEDDLIRVFSKESSYVPESQTSIPESYIGEKNSENKPHGKGKYTYADGSTYDGYWVNGFKHGTGTQCDAKGKIIRGYWWQGELIHIFGNEELPKPEDKLPKNKNKIIAVLIGNNYPGTHNELSKCTADVDAIEQRLKNIGVHVRSLKNASEKEIFDVIREACKKDNLYDNLLIYFSGHGETHHYNFVKKIDDKTAVRVLGPFHSWISNDNQLVYQEWDLLTNIKDSKFKNVIIINDACQVTRLYDFNDLSEGYKNVVLDAYTNQNNWKSRNLLTANAALEGWEATDWSNDKCGLYALGLIQYLEQKNLPVVKMFGYVNDFVVKYSMREKGKIIQQPNVNFTKFDTNFCLYNPEE